jgi:PAS domain S-box-containing protein
MGDNYQKDKRIFEGPGFGQADGETARFQFSDVALSQGAALFKSFFDGAAIGFSITDLNGRFLKVNPAYCAITGYTEAELYSLDFQSITHPEDLPRTMAKLANLISGEFSSCLIEERYVRKDEIVVWVLNSVSIIRDQSGRPTNLIELSQDITEQMQLEESLRQAELHTESILASITDTHILFDRQWRYLYVNEACVRAMGRPRNEIIGRALWEVYPDIAGTELEREYRRAMNEHAQVNLDFHYPSTDTWWQNRFYPVRAGLAVFATDITGWRQAEKLLRQSETQLAEAQNVAHLGNWNWDIQSNTVTWSDEFYRICGFRPRSFSPNYEAFLALVHPEDRESVERAQANCLGRHEAFSFQQRIIRPDKEVRVLQSYGNVVCDDTGNPTRTFGACQDITEQRRAEKALREAELKYRDIFENAGEGIFQTTPEGQYIAANPALARMHGFASPEEFINSRQDITWKVYVDPARREEFKRLVDEQGVVRGFEHQIYRKDGSKIWISVNARAVRDEYGTIRYYEGTTQDITERKLAEARLKQSESQLAEAQRQVHLGSWTSDLATNDVVLSDELFRLFGLKPQQSGATHEAFLELVHPEDRKRVQTATEEAIRTRQSCNFEYRIGRTDGVERILFERILVTVDERTNAVRLFGTTQDVTERKQAEAELRESEERFSKAFYSSPVPLIITRRADGCLLNVNDSFLSTFGYERAEVIGKTVLSLNIYVDAKDRRKLIGELRKEGALSGYESRARTKSGRILDLLVFVESLKLKGEQCILSTAYDITERKSVEEALRASEERYRELFDNSKDALYVHDLSGRYLSFNRAAERLSGYSRVEILGKHFSNFVAPSHLGQVRENLCRKLDEVGETTYEIELVTKDRRRVPVEVSSRLIYEDGKPVGVQGTVRDITELKRAEAARTQFAWLVESSDDGIIAKTLDGIILSWNSGAEKIYGYSSAEVIGCSIALLAPTDRRDELPLLLERLGRGESIHHYETVRRRKDGKLIDVSLTLSPIRDARNMIVGASTIARDVTEKKQAERALNTFSRRLIEAQEAERQHIARELHDEIGQVLTAVRINLQSLRSPAQASPVSLALDDSLAIVDEALEAVRELSLNLRPPVLDNLGLASALRWYVDRYARRSGIVAELNNDLEDGHRLSVELETGCFRIVQEALTNVARHARATHVFVDLKRSNGNLELRIRDDGVGFDIGWLLKNSGLGSASALGLRGMKERAVALNGRLKIDSKPKSGTKISVSFPLQEGR